MSKRDVNTHTNKLITRPSEYTTENVAIDVPSKKAKLTEKIEEAINSYENGTIKGDVVTDYMTGFLDPTFQGLIKQTKKNNLIYAHPQYVNKNTIEFELKVPVGFSYNPSTLILVLPIKFTSVDGKSALPANVCAVNAWSGKLIESIEIFKNNTNVSITPQQEIKPYKLMIDELKKIPPSKLSLIEDLQYSNKEVTVDTRRSNTTSTAEDNLDDRYTKFYDIQKADNYYQIPLKFLNRYFQIDEIVSENIKIVLNLENDMRKIFERKGTLTTSPHKAPGDYVFHKSPYIICPTFSTSPYYRHFKGEGMKSSNNYRLGITDVYTTRTYEMAATTNQENIEFGSIVKQFNWLELNLYPGESVNHTSPFDTYGRNFITSKLSSIEIENVGASYKTTDLSFNLDKYEDKSLLYNNFLAFMADSCSLNDRTSYLNSELIETLPNQKKYFDGTTNYPIYIDLRASAGYLKMLDPINRDDANLLIKVKTKDAVPNGTFYILECHGISKGEYMEMKKDNEVYIAFIAYSTESIK